MTTRERAYTHLQNARALYQHLTNQTGDQVAWRAAQVLSRLECAIDEGDEKTLEAIGGSAERVKALTRTKRNGRRKRRADDALGGATRQDDTMKTRRQGGERLPRRNPTRSTLLTEWGLCATHVHWDNPRWKAHLLDLTAERCRGPWRFRLHRWADSTRQLNLDLFHVASMAAHYPIIGLVLYHVGSWPLAIACAVGAQLVWRIVIHRSGRGWQSWWLRLARKVLRV